MNLIARPRLRNRCLSVAQAAVLVLAVAARAFAAGPELVAQGGHLIEVKQLAASGDGRFLASGDGRTVKVWDLSADLLARTCPVAASLLDLSPDGRWLAVYRPAGDAGELGTVELWDAQAGRAVRTLLDGRAFPAGMTTRAVDAVRFTPDARWVAIATHGEKLDLEPGDHPRDLAVRFVDVSTGNEAFRLSADAGQHRAASAMTSLAFSPDGATLYAGTAPPLVELRRRPTSAVWMWDVPGRRLAGTLAGAAPGAVQSLALSPDGATVAALTGQEWPVALPLFPGQSPPAPEQRVVAWDARTRQPLPGPFALTGHAFALAFSGGGARLLVASSGPLSGWAVATGEPLAAPFEPGGQARTVLATVPASPYVAAGNSDDGGIALFDVTGASSPVLLPGTDFGSTHVTFAGDGRSLLLLRDRHAYRWDLSPDPAAGRPALFSRLTDGLPPRCEVDSIAIGPGGTPLVLVNREFNQGLTLCDGTTPRDLPGVPRNAVVNMASLVAGGSMVVATFGGAKPAVVQAWDTSTLRPIGTAGPFTDAPHPLVLTVAADRSPGKPPTVLVNVSQAHGCESELWDLAAPRRLWRGTLREAGGAEGVRDPDNRRWGMVLPESQGIEVVDLVRVDPPRWVPVKDLPVFASINDAAFANGGRTIHIALADGTSRDVDVGTPTAAVGGPMTSVLFPPPGYATSPGGTLRATVDADRGVRLTRTGDGQELARLLFHDVPNRNVEAVVLAPDGHYATTAHGSRLVAFRAGDAVVPFDAFDATLNRPDLVLSRMGVAPISVVAQYRSACEARARRLGTPLPVGDVGGWPDPARLATVQIDRAGFKPVTDADIMTLHVRVRAAAEGGPPVAGVSVEDDGVPVSGLSGRPLVNGEATVDVPLTTGRNVIRVSAAGDDAGRAMADRVVVVRTSAPPRRRLFVLAVGVSAYDDGRFALKYAAKDANAIAAVFEGRPADLQMMVLGPGHPGGEAVVAERRTIEVRRLIDADATREKIRDAHAWLAQSAPDDTVIVLLAGHGLLDRRLDFYYATVDVDFAHPAARGLSYDDLDRLLGDGVAARHKLLLVDSCHSGDLDPPATTQATPADPQVALAGARGLAGADGAGGGRPAVDTAALLNDLFTDLRHGSGTVVIAAAAGRGSALEPDELAHGAFTRAVLDALTVGHADANHDGRVSVDELRDFVVPRVIADTHGRQVPAVRREADEQDFPVD